MSSMAARVAALGLVELRPGVVAYAQHYAPPVVPLRSLIMVPHGRTPSNARLLFQSHAEGPNATLLPESLVAAVLWRAHASIRQRALAKKGKGGRARGRGRSPSPK